jgi:hypothetical protein
MKNNMTFDEFAIKYCDRLYNPKLTYEEQCTGYKELRRMVEHQITPATREEGLRWENFPTQEELISIPNTKYMRFLHPLLREFVQENWEIFKDLKL